MNDKIKKITRLSNRLIKLSEKLKHNLKDLKTTLTNIKKVDADICELRGQEPLKFNETLDTLEKSVHKVLTLNVRKKKSG